MNPLRKRLEKWQFLPGLDLRIGFLGRCMSSFDITVMSETKSGNFSDDASDHRDAAENKARLYGRK